MNQLLTNARLALYVDERILLELASDNNTDGTLAADTITAAIKRAGEEIASAATRSNTYSTVDLDTLAAANNGMLEGLVSDLALCFLFERRGGDVPEVVTAKATRAQAYLSDLRDGKRVFANDTNRAAGLPSVAVISVQARGNLGMNSDSSFFPVRKDRIY